MYKKDLDQMIQSGHLPHSLLLYGESYATTTYAHFIADKLAPKESRLTLYYDEYDFRQAKTYLSQASLFGDTNLLYLKTDKKIPKKELDSLVETCQKQPKSFFIFEFCGEDRTAKDMSRSFSKKKGADFVRFFKPTPAHGVEILAKQARKINLEIDHFALTHLLELEQEDLLLAQSELPKLALLNKKITVQDIDQHVAGMGIVDLDRFLSKFLQKEMLNEEISLLLEHEGVEEIAILTQIESYITTLALFRIYITAHGTYDVVEILGYPLPAHLAKIRAAQSTKLSLAQYSRLLRHLSDAHLTLKTATNLDKESFLIATLIKLQTFL